MAIVTTLDLGRGLVSTNAYLRIKSVALRNCDGIRKLIVDVETYPSVEQRKWKVIRDYVALRELQYSEEEKVKIATEVLTGTRIYCEPMQAYTLEVQPSIKPSFDAVAAEVAAGDGRALLYQLIRDGEFKELRFCPQVESGEYPLDVVDDLSSSSDIMEEVFTKWPWLRKGES